MVKENFFELNFIVNLISSFQFLKTTAMKKLLLIPAILAIKIFSLQSQPVSDYLCKLNNGITIASEHTWSHVWVQQNYAAMPSGDQNPLKVDVRALGDLISGSSYVLMSKGKEVKNKNVAPGAYDLKMTFKLSGEPGTLGFVVGNVLIKPQMKTNVAVTLYDYQVMIDESAASSADMASFESNVQRCKASLSQADLQGIPAFYAKGDHSKAITADEGNGKTKGKIKPGIYDMLINISISGQNHKVWLGNFNMKGGTNYKVTTNLNAGGIIYTGPNKDVKALHLYPAGTSAKQTGTPSPAKNLEIIVYSNVANLNCCTPGTFDVLLNMGKDKFEWRKNVAVTTGAKTEIK